MDKVIYKTISNGVFPLYGIQKLVYEGKCIAYRLQFANKCFDIQVNLSGKLPLPFNKATKELELYESDGELITSAEDGWYKSKVQEILEDSDLMRVLRSVKYDFSRLDIQ